MIETFTLIFQTPNFSFFTQPKGCDYQSLFVVAAISTPGCLRRILTNSAPVYPVAPMIETFTLIFQTPNFSFFTQPDMRGTSPRATVALGFIPNILSLLGSRRLQPAFRSFSLRSCVLVFSYAT